MWIDEMEMTSPLPAATESCNGVGSVSFHCADKIGNRFGVFW